MKKPRLQLLVLVTVAFAAFTLGLFLGRNQQKAPVTVSVPARMQTQPPETAVPSEAPAQTDPPITFPIDINAAGKDELMALPGIGEVLAQRILDHREEHGPFLHVEGLMNVEGIGEKRMEEILELITIGGSL